MSDLREEPGLTIETAPPRAQRRQERAKASLREAAKKAFELHGYAKATVQHILDEADITRRTFYRYFSSKDDVFAELLDQLVDDLCATVTLAGRERSLRARLHTRTVAALRMAAENRAFLGAVDEAIRVNEEHAARWERLREILESEHRAALAWCIEHGIMDPADTALLSRILTGMIGSVILDVARYGTDDPETLEGTVVDLYWNMLFRPHEGADDYVLDRLRPKAVFEPQTKRRATAKR